MEPLHLLFSVHLEEWLPNAAYSTNTSLISIHLKETYSVVAAWVKTKLSFALLRSAVLCIKRTRHTTKTIATDTGDIRFEVKMTNIDDEYVFDFLDSTSDDNFFIAL